MSFTETVRTSLCTNVDAQLDPCVTNYPQLYKNGANTPLKAATPPLCIIRKKTVSKGPGFGAVDALEAVSPREKGLSAQKNRPTPFDSCTKGAKWQRRLNNRTLQRVQNADSNKFIWQWLSTMENSEYTENVAMAAASWVDYDSEECSTSASHVSREDVAAAASAAAGTSGLGLFARRIGRNMKRNPLCVLKSAIAAFQPGQPVPDNVTEACVYPLSHPVRVFDLQ